MRRRKRRHAGAAAQNYRKTLVILAVGLAVICGSIQSFNYAAAHHASWGNEIGYLYCGGLIGGFLSFVFISCLLFVAQVGKDLFLEVRHYLGY